jgi:hypothetical protein
MRARDQYPTRRSAQKTTPCHSIKPCHRMMPFVLGKVVGQNKAILPETNVQSEQPETRELNNACGVQ